MHTPDGRRRPPLPGTFAGRGRAVRHRRRARRARRGACSRWCRRASSASSSTRRPASSTGCSGWRQRIQRPVCIAGHPEQPPTRRLARGAATSPPRANADGAALCVQIAGRPGRRAVRPRHHLPPVRPAPVVRACSPACPLPRSWRACAIPPVRAAIAGRDARAADPMGAFRWTRMFVVHRSAADRLRARPDAASIAALAERAGTLPRPSTSYDADDRATTRVRCSCCRPQLRRRRPSTRCGEMLLHPATVLGLADGGAHVGMICDASIPTFDAHPLGPRPLTRRTAPARARGPAPDVARRRGSTALHDRGVIAPGMPADLNVIDFDRLRGSPPRGRPRPPRRRPPAACSAPTGTSPRSSAESRRSRTTRSPANAPAASGARHPPRASAVFDRGLPRDLVALDVAGEALGELAGVEAVLGEVVAVRAELPSGWASTYAVIAPSPRRRRARRRRRRRSTRTVRDRVGARGRRTARRRSGARGARRGTRRCAGPTPRASPASARRCRRVVGVGEGRRQRADEAAHRRGQHDRVAVQQHEARVGVHRGEVLERDRVVRALQRPPPAHAPALEHLQHRPVVLVRGALVDAEQPARRTTGRWRSPPRSGS